jgi:hypothetical protein
MQTPTDGPRAGYTTKQVAYLIENTPVVDTGFGMELLNQDLSVASDVSDFLVSATVTRSSYAAIHGSASFTLSQPLSWGNSIVRPYFTMTGPISSTAVVLTTMRFNLGAYYTDTPVEDLSQIPSTFDVTGYDVLSILDDAIGDAYSIDTGIDPLDAIEAILLARGVTQYQIDRDSTARGVLLTSPMVWTLDDNVTWLTAVNKLLAYVGYQGIWSDWNGVLRAQTYTTPSDRAPEWVMDAAIADTILTQRRKRTHDYYDAPNRWVFYWGNNTDGAQPVDGAGRYEFINNTEGETSVEARGGRTITKTTSLDAADQASLVAAAQQTIDADMQVPTTFEHETAPFPLAWHFDKYTVNDPVLGAAQDVLSSSWSLNLDGSDMAHSWQVI